MKKSTTKHALLMSVVSLFLCFSMLIGTTYAWFTDEVTSGTNKIVAGNLDVELYNAIGVDASKKIDTNTELFKLEAPDLWEPGAVVYENFTVVNEGNLALKYQFSVAISNAIGAKNLADVLKVGVVEGGIADGTSREEALADVNDAWLPFKTFIELGELYPDGNAEGKATSKTYGIVIWWEPSANDNDYNMNNGKTEADQLKIDIGVTLYATQLQAERDSFDNTYDEKAPYAMIIVKDDVNDAEKVEVGKVAVTVPAGAPAGSYSLPTPEIVKSEDAATGQTVLECDITLSLNGDPISTPTPGIEYEVELYVGEMLSIFSVYHKDVAITNYNYNAITGILSFTTDSFSPFKVIGEFYAD